jgi:hypothetical protein
MKDSYINTGYLVTGSDILSPGGGHSGYYISRECILHGTSDTGYYVSGEVIYRRPTDDDTGFRVWGGVIYGPSRNLPFLR